MTRSRNKIIQKILDRSNDPRIKKVLEARKEKIKEENDALLDHYYRTDSAKYNFQDVDFSLFNLILSTIDFSKPEFQDKSPLDMMRTLYAIQWPYMAKLINENLQMKTFLVENAFDRIEEMEDFTPFKVALTDIIKTETDPTVNAKTALNKIKNAAKLRSKMAKKGISI
jgi:hypothetical protein